MTEPVASAAIELAPPGGVVDHEAIAALYDTCGREAFAIALMMLGDRRHAERVVEEAFRGFDARPRAALTPRCAHAPSFSTTPITRL